MRNCNRETKNEVRKSNRRKYKKFKGLDKNLSFIVLNTTKFVRLVINYSVKSALYTPFSLQAIILILFKRATPCSFINYAYISRRVCISNSKRFIIFYGDLFFSNT
jgi:hypothetical protein